jgi:hypothetical protein
MVADFAVSRFTACGHGGWPGRRFVMRITIDSLCRVAMLPNEFTEDLKLIVSTAAFSPCKTDRPVAAFVQRIHFDSGVF